VEKFCASVTETAKQSNDEVIAEAALIERKFKKAFSLFGDCHRIYNKCHVDSEDITKLHK